MISLTDLSSSEGRKKQYYSIDLMKLVCSLFIVAAHFPPLRSVNHLANDVLFYIGRLAVPFYFISSGYFLFRKSGYDIFDEKIAVKYAFCIFKLYVIWELIYLLPDIFYKIINNENGVIHDLIGHIKNFVFVGYLQLWYFNATIFAVLAVAFLVKRKVKLKSILYLGLILYILGLLGGHILQ